MKTQRQRHLSQLEYARRCLAKVRGCECHGSLVNACDLCKAIRALEDVSIELLAAERRSAQDRGA